MVPVEVLISGFFSLFLIIIFFIIGLMIALKYREFKKPALLYMGLAWIGISQLWWSSCITVFMVFFECVHALV